MAIVTVIQGSLHVQGDITAAGTPQPLTRAQLTQENNARYKLRAEEWRVWDDIRAMLPAAAASDDLGIIGGTFGSASPIVRTSDSKATSVTQRARLTYALPTEYVAGASVTVRLFAGMFTTVSDGTATIDVEAYRSDDAAGIGSDLCTTAAQTINSLTEANKDFVITAASLMPGDTLDIRVTVAITDSATGTAVIGQFTGELLLGVKG